VVILRQVIFHEEVVIAIYNDAIPFLLSLLTDGCRNIRLDRIKLYIIRFDEGRLPLKYLSVAEIVLPVNLRSFSVSFCAVTRQDMNSITKNIDARICILNAIFTLTNSYDNESLAHREAKIYLTYIGSDCTCIALVNNPISCFFAVIEKILLKFY